MSNPRSVQRRFGVSGAGFCGASCCEKIAMLLNTLRNEIEWIFRSTFLANLEVEMWGAGAPAVPGETDHFACCNITAQRGGYP